jgi:multidrug resistance efflux pump
MPEIKEFNTIEIRSEEVNDILGRPPRRIIRSGISVIFTIVLILLTGSWFFKYPDTVSSPIIISTEIPPVDLQADSSAILEKLLIQDKELVSQNKVLAVLANSASLNDVLYLKSVLDTLQKIDFFNVSANLDLGSIQPSYTSFIKILKIYQTAQKLDYHSKKISAIQELISGIRNHQDLPAEDVTIQLNQLNQQILDLQHAKQKEDLENNNMLSNALNRLKSQLSQWQLRHLIIAPVAGQIIFPQPLHEQQKLHTGEVICSIIQTEDSNVIGMIEITGKDAGNVKKGQRVIIKLEQYPFMEYGMIDGCVHSISPLPIMKNNQLVYKTIIEIDDSFLTNYGMRLRFSHRMAGTATIITEDLKLIERLLVPLKRKLTINRDF